MIIAMVDVADANDVVLHTDRLRPILQPSMTTDFPLFRVVLGIFCLRAQKAGQKRLNIVLPSVLGGSSVEQLVAPGDKEPRRCSKRRVDVRGRPTDR